MKKNLEKVKRCELRVDRQLGLALEDIAAEFDLSYNAVCNALLAHGVVQLRAGVIEFEKRPTCVVRPG